MNFDVVIIGGGASGLMCTVAAKQNNKKIKIAVIEKNDRVGKKLLATGNGRCNLTNANVSAENYKGSFQPQSRSILEKYNTDFILSYFENLGLHTFCDSEGRYYPVSKQASSVLDVLRFACDRLDIACFCGESIRTVGKKGNLFYVKTAAGEFTSRKLVIACGSKAAPKLGGSASGIDYLRNFGHKTEDFSPALCPIKVKSGLLKSLKGLRASGSARLIRKGKIVKAERGEIQFTENALSGICVFNLSLCAQPDDIISLDLFDDISEKEIFSIVSRNKKLFGSLTVDNILTGIFQKRITQAVLKLSNVKNFSRLGSDLSDGEIQAIAHTVKNMEFSVAENAGFEQAQCALGGVIGSEIDENTMQSKKVKNLYVCGEAVDICGECGGYNLHFAFASGIAAGESL